MHRPLELTRLHKRASLPNSAMLTYNHAASMRPVSPINTEICEHERTTDEPAPSAPVRPASGADRSNRQAEGLLTLPAEESQMWYA